MTNHYGALKGIAKEFPFRKANSYVGAKIVPYIGSTSLSADDVPVNDVSAIPAANHGYGMNVMDDDTSIASYGESIANFGAAYTATQESMKSQGFWVK